MPSFSEWKARREADTGTWRDDLRRRMGMGKKEVVEKNEDDEQTPKPDEKQEEKVAPSPSASKIRHMVGLDRFDLFASNAEATTHYVIAAPRKEHDVVDGVGTFKAEKVKFRRLLDVTPADYADSKHMDRYDRLRKGQSNNAEKDKRKVKEEMMYYTCSTLKSERYAPEVLWAFADQKEAIFRTNDTPDANLHALLGFMMMAPVGTKPDVNMVSAETTAAIEAKLTSLALTRAEVRDAATLEKGTPYMVPYSNAYTGSKVEPTLKSVSAFVALPFPPIKEQGEGGDPLSNLASKYVRQPCWSKTDTPSTADLRISPDYMSKKIRGGAEVPRLIEDTKHKLTPMQLRHAFSHMLYPVHVTKTDGGKGETTIQWGAHPIFVPREETIEPVNAHFRSNRMGERQLLLTPVGKTMLSTRASPSRDLLNYRVVHQGALYPIADEEVSREDPPVHLDMLVAWTARKLGYGLNAVKTLKPGPDDVALVEAATAITRLAMA